MSRDKVAGTLKDNLFKVECRNCGHVGEARNFIASADVWIDSEDKAHVTQKIITLRCPSCKVSEGLNKSPLW